MTTQAQGGIIAIWGHPSAVTMAGVGLHAQQHRGVGTVGICAVNNGCLTCHRALGFATEASTASVLRPLEGSSAIGYVGCSGGAHPQPLEVSSDLGARAAIVYNGGRQSDLNPLFATILSYIHHLSDRELALILSDQVSGLDNGYALAALTPNRMIVARDRHGIRPLVVGALHGHGWYSTVFASESTALTGMSASFCGEVEPGEVIIVSARGIHRAPQGRPVEAKTSRCRHELIAIASEDSVVFGRHVREVRRSLGIQLARECSVKVDLVLPIEPSSVTAAEGYCAESGTVGGPALFNQGSDPFVATEPIAGRRVALLAGVITDFVTGQMLYRTAVRTVREAGATAVHFLVACSPIIEECFYGVNLPGKEDLLCANNTIEEIRQYLCVDSLTFLSTRRVWEAIGRHDADCQYCKGCSQGYYPTVLDLSTMDDINEPTEQFVEQEFIALALIENRVKLVSIAKDGGFRLLDNFECLHSILYVNCSEWNSLHQAVEELEFLINDHRTRESDLQEFFERNPDFITYDEYRSAHPRIVLAREGSDVLKPDFVLEPINQNRLCDLLELKLPSAQVFVLKKHRLRFSAAVLEAASQLREYSLFFDEQKNREAVQRCYGLLAYRPRMFVIIGRAGRIDPIALRRIELDAPHLHLKTYDEIVVRMKDRLDAMRRGTLGRS